MSIAGGIARGAENYKEREMIPNPIREAIIILQLLARHNIKGLIDGTHVVVPRIANKEMSDAYFRVVTHPDNSGYGANELHEMAYKAMIRASQEDR
jgi:hypothetical protein